MAGTVEHPLEGRMFLVPPSDKSLKRSTDETYNLGKKRPKFRLTSDEETTAISNELEFQEYSQEELRKIYSRPRRHRNIKLTLDSEESEESEEEEGLTYEEFKETVGGKLLMECINKKFPVKTS